MDIKSLYQKYLQSGKVSTDTRQITPGSVFFALKGPNFNANTFAEEALKKGAAYAVVDEPTFVKDERYILAENGLDALQKLARHHRDQLKIPVIGLTGSNGKTTSKELVSVVLSKKFKTYATKGNLNNHIGVPLTILAIDSSIEMAVVEMGANHVGEIASLSAISNPTHGFITNIGKAHIGTFGGFENIIRGKSELYQHLINNNGQVFINSQNSILANMAKRFKSPLFYPASGDYYHCELMDADPFIRYKDESGTIVQTQLMGDYNFENIAVALCVGKFFGVKSTDANKAIEEYVPGNMRSQVLKKGTNTIILDAYNANPSSMEVAINSLAAMSAKQKVAILGDMYELEEEAEAEHRKIGQLLNDKKFNQAYVCGDLMQAATRQESASNSSIQYFKTKEELIEHLKRNPIQDSTILIKASRGMALEKIVDYL
jgi:UDP-N-acetylmuramoyl-tripeptide--D-alanyl-D-alanine ligase